LSEPRASRPRRQGRKSYVNSTKYNIQTTSSVSDRACGHGFERRAGGYDGFVMRLSVGYASQAGGQPPEFPTNFRNKEKQDNNNEEFDPGSG